MWCPKCKSEFRGGFTECPECKVPLVETLEEEKPSETVEPVLLMSFQDRNELELAAGVLDRAGIPYLLKEPGSGEYLRIVTGQNMFGTELYVDPRVQGTALRLLRRCDQEETAAEFDDDALNAAIDEFESEYPDEAKPEEAASGSEGYQTLLIFLAIFGLIVLAAVAIPFLRSLAMS